MSRARRVRAVALAASAFVLSSCGHGAGYHYAWGLHADDLVGTWSTTNDLGTRIALAEDGSFSVDSWPTNLACRGEQAGDIDDLRATPGDPALGTWRFTAGDGDDVSGGTLPVLTLLFSDYCTQTPLAILTRASDGTVSMCFSLDTDPDSFTSSRMFPFLREPVPSGDADDSC